MIELHRLLVAPPAEAADMLGRARPTDIDAMTLCSALINALKRIAELEGRLDERFEMPSDAEVDEDNARRSGIAEGGFR